MFPSTLLPLNKSYFPTHLMWVEGSMKAAMARQSFSMALRTFLAALPFLLSNAATSVSRAETTSGHWWRRKIARFGLVSMSLQDPGGRKVSGKKK